MDTEVYSTNLITEHVYNLKFLFILINKDLSGITKGQASL